MEDRFHVHYHLAATDERDARARAVAITLEQTVEVDDALVPPGFIREQIIGRLEELVPSEDGFGAIISYAESSSAFELTQLLNVIFGNSSIKPGIKVADVRLSAGLLRHFPGPRFGISGLRRRLGIAARPLLCTALKPMGESPAQLADKAYHFALGGIDIIKDDHGLSDQIFCPFEARVQACAEAVARANRDSGRQAIYVANVSAPYDQLQARAHYAKQAGAGGLMVAPGLTGFDALRLLAADATLDLPLLAHPALLGSFVMAPSMSHAVTFATLMRIAGADASIYPNYGGRFGFSEAECLSIATACRTPLGTYPAIFPSPGGGMDLQRVPELLRAYGEDVIFLIGGALYARSPDLTDNARYFASLVGSTLRTVL
jgi:ribulose-bisphosphate carboxylase large chain